MGNAPGQPVPCPLQSPPGCSGPGHRGRFRVASWSREWAAGWDAGRDALCTIAFSNWHAEIETGWTSSTGARLAWPPKMPALPCCGTGLCPVPLTSPHVSHPLPTQCPAPARGYRGSGRGEGGQEGGAPQSTPTSSRGSCPVTGVPRSVRRHLRGYGYKRGCCGSPALRHLLVLLLGLLDHLEAEREGPPPSPQLRPSSPPEPSWALNELGDRDGDGDRDRAASLKTTPRHPEQLAHWLCQVKELLVRPQMSSHEAVGKHQQCWEARHCYCTTPSLLLLINEAEKERLGGSSQPCPLCTPPQALILSVSSTF